MIINIWHAGLNNKKTLFNSWLKDKYARKKSIKAEADWFRSVFSKALNCYWRLDVEEKTFIDIGCVESSSSAGWKTRSKINSLNLLA